MLPIHQPGIEVHRIEMLNGYKEFCQEFLTDVRVPDTDRVGEVDDGWTVGTRWMFHERMLYNSPLVTMPDGGTRGGDGAASMLDVAARRRPARRPASPATSIGEARMLDARRRARSSAGSARASRTGTMSDQAVGHRPAVRRRRRRPAAPPSPSSSPAAPARRGPTTTAPPADVGNDFLMRQVACIGGGTTEMARNVISERVLGMPRERTLDRDVAFRDVPRSAPAG